MVRVDNDLLCFDFNRAPESYRILMSVSNKKMIPNKGVMSQSLILLIVPVVVSIVLVNVHSYEYMKCDFTALFSVC